VAIVTGSFSLIVYLGGGTKSSRAFAHGVFWFSLWAVAMGFFVCTKDKELSIFFTNLTYFLGSVIAAAFFIFFYTFPEDRKIPRKIIIFLIVSELIFLFLYLTTDLMVGEFTYISKMDFWGWQIKPLNNIFDIYFFSIFGFGIYRLYRNYSEESDAVLKRNLKYMLISFFVGVIPPSFFDIILQRFGIFNLNWLGPIIGLFWVLIVGYSMLKYKQMRVKLLFSEIFIVAMLVISLMNIFVDISFGIYGKIALPILLCLFGYFLIKSVLHEANQGEQLKILNVKLADLNSNLEKRVSEQTVEIRKAYEVEKRARAELQELDQNKNDFIIITQHHLRTPLAQIRWYSDSLLSGLYGDISRECTVAISGIGKAAEKLLKTLNNFLDISELKIGTQILSFQPQNIKHILELLLNEISSDIKKRGIKVNFSEDQKLWPLVECDSARIKDALSIILDNAVKYNLDGGTINISTRKKGVTFLMEIVNTGVSLTSDDKANIFKKSFFRSKEAKKANPLGMGVGLLVARTIIEAHKGAISIQPNPDSRGAKVVIELPFVGGLARCGD
jgi:signal transduction histidine kinase